MRLYTQLIGFTLYAIFLSSISDADDRTHPTTRRRQAANPKQAAARPLEAAIAEAIRKTSASFVDAFNQGDAKSVAEHWTEEGVYVDEDGRRYVGRNAIQQEYADFFNRSPGLKMNVVIDSVQVVDADTVLESGRASIKPAPEGAPGASEYTALHVRRDGEWLMANVRDRRVETPSTYGHLQGLEWLIGTWSTTNDEVTVTMTYRWIAQKSFIERTFTASQADHVLESGTQIIGFDPIQGHVMSWSFASGGGRAVGVWTAHDEGWAVENAGVTRDGLGTTSIDIWTRIGNHAIARSSTARSVDGLSLPDLKESILKRSQK